MDPIGFLGLKIGSLQVHAGYLIFSLKKLPQCATKVAFAQLRIFLEGTMALTMTSETRVLVYVTYHQS